ncbi:5'-3' exonuclease [Bacillus aquiflavi]|uniref:5'-3' exonuclease n=1 Tax=Bacillus aquiflavi TaxID=2672567 RepID=UPI00223B601B|nr:5'-3' exonuclease H3TH domain-containing protein [Bacillus aquiflavi]
MNSKKPSLMLVDGMALLFRAYFATAVTGQFMFNSRGIPTNGVYGFIKHFMSAVSAFQPSHVAVCWDMGSKTFRTEMYSQYKANRSEPPAELIPQFELAKEVVEAFDIPSIGLKGYEADDCIGTIAHQHRDKAMISILTGDQDILQLIDDDISVILLKKGFANYLVHTKETFMTEKGIFPKQLIDVKAFMGDPSDNYPGVKGIGEKTALKLIKEFNNVDGVLQNIDKLTKNQKSKIEAEIEMLYLSRRLAEIKCDVPIQCSLDETEFKFNWKKTFSALAEIEIKGLHRLLNVHKETAALKKAD